MASLQEYELNYHAPDRDYVLEQIRKYGTDDRSKWTDAAPAPAPTNPGATPPYQNEPIHNPPAGTSPTYGRTNQPYTAPATPPSGYPSWASSSGGQTLFRNMKTAFPDMSDAEIWAHLNYPDMPDQQFMDAIMQNLQAHRPASTTAPTTPTTTTTPANTTTTPAGWSQQRWNELIGQYPGTVAGLQQLVNEHPELGISIVGGSRGDIKLPDGTIVDVMLAAGEGGRGWQWLTGGGGGGSAPTPTPTAPTPTVPGGFGGGIDPNSPYLQPWTSPFTFSGSNWSRDPFTPPPTTWNPAAYGDARWRPQRGAVGPWGEMPYARPPRSSSPGGGVPASPTEPFYPPSGPTGGWGNDVVTPPGAGGGTYPQQNYPPLPTGGWGGPGSDLMTPPGGGAVGEYPQQYQPYARRQTGGPVGPGEPYIVGEQGPEVFVPGQPGVVAPNTTEPQTAYQQQNASTADKAAGASYLQQSGVQSGAVGTTGANSQPSGWGNDTVDLSGYQPGNFPNLSPRPAGAVGQYPGQPGQVAPLQPYAGQQPPGIGVPFNPHGELPSAPAYEYGMYNAPDKFVAPQGEEVYNDPGYQFRKNEAEKAFQNSAAARGVTRSGGNLKDFLKYGQEMASQEYANVYNRRKGEYDTAWDQSMKDYEADRETYGNQYSPKLLDWQSRNNDLRRQQELDYDRRWKEYLNTQDVENGDYDRAWQEYLNAQETFYKNQDRPWNKLTEITKIGAGAI